MFVRNTWNHLTVSSHHSLKVKLPTKYSLTNYIYIYIYIYIYLDLHSITDKLNNVEPSLKFPYELEYNCTLPFLDILLIRNINKLEFKVYRKTTCKNDRIHLFTPQQQY